MLTRILVGVVAIPLFALIVLLAPEWTFALLIAAIAATAAWELVRATAKVPMRVRIYTVVSAALLPMGFLFGNRTGAIALGFIALVLLTVIFLEAIFTFDRRNTVSYESLLTCLFAGVIVPALLASLVVMRGYGVEGNGRWYVFLAMGLAFITDGGAYFMGILMGKHRGITHVSPNKSVEGFIGGLVIGVLFALLIGIILQFALEIPVSYPLLVVYGFLGALTSEIGDLAFSLIKREYGVKDFGKIIPGHGGTLDRFDSMVFCAPMILLLSMCFAAF